MRLDEWPLLVYTDAAQFLLHHLRIPNFWFKSTVIYCDRAVKRFWSEDSDFITVTLNQLIMILKSKVGSNRQINQRLFSFSIFHDWLVSQSSQFIQRINWILSLDQIKVLIHPTSRWQ